MRKFSPFHRWGPCLLRTPHPFFFAEKGLLLLLFPHFLFWLNTFAAAFLQTVFVCTVARDGGIGGGGRCLKCKVPWDRAGGGRPGGSLVWQGGGRVEEGLPVGSQGRRTEKRKGNRRVRTKGTNGPEGIPKVFYSLIFLMFPSPLACELTLLVLRYKKVFFNAQLCYERKGAKWKFVAAWDLLLPTISFFLLPHSELHPPRAL